MSISRVHWFLLHLDDSILKSYKFRYDYVSHNYFIYRNKGYSILDCFIVIRTSFRCFRCMYFNNTTKTFHYFSCKKSKQLANKIKDIISTIGEI